MMFVYMLRIASFSAHYTSPMFFRGSVVFCGLIVSIFGARAMVSWQLRKHSDNYEPRWYFFIFVSCLIAWLAAIVCGSWNYAANMKPYYAQAELKMYTSVDPQATRGSQIMDAGSIIFTPNARVDIHRSMGFKDDDVYCVAPVVSPTLNATMATYDFWAVGVNCCSGHAADFACAIFDDVHAHAGLRVLGDDLLPKFRLAVEQAESAYRVKAANPIFVYWAADPLEAAGAYREAALKAFAMAVLTHFALQLFAVVIAATTFLKVAETW